MEDDRIQLIIRGRINRSNVFLSFYEDKLIISTLKSTTGTVLGCLVAGIPGLLTGGGPFEDGLATNLMLEVQSGKDPHIVINSCKTNIPLPYSSIKRIIRKEVTKTKNPFKLEFSFLIETIENEKITVNYATSYWTDLDPIIKRSFFANKETAKIGIITHENYENKLRNLLGDILEEELD